MSKKTIKQRIAVVAASALTAGFLSVVSMPVANAAAGDIAIAANGASTTTSRGIVSINGTAASNASLTTSAALTNYGTILSNGDAYVTLGVGSNGTSLAVSGGTISTCVMSGGSDAVTLNGARTNCSTVATATNTLQVNVVPNAGATSMVITGYDDDATATRTAVGGITFTVVASSTVGVFDASSSLFSTEASLTAAADNTDANWTPTGGTSPTAAVTERNAGAAGYIGFDIKDANGTRITAPVVSISTTAGCVVNSSDAKGTVTFASTTTPNTAFRIDQASSATPAKCTATVSVNGTVAASRVFNFRGGLASIDIKQTNVKRVEAKSAASSAAIFAEALDSAGNKLTNVSIAPDSSYYNAGLTNIGTITTAPFGTAATDGTAAITCGVSGDYKMKLQATSSTGVNVKSTEFTVSCAGAPVNYKASLDKASYVPGDVATLTISATDDVGRLTNNDAVVGDSTYVVSIAGSNMTAVSTPTNADTFTNGVKTYKFIVGSTEGSYQLAVDLPKYNSTTYSQTALTVSYAIKASTASVSNADVLKSIVALIASINKQIQALQKLILARR